MKKVYFESRGESGNIFFVLGRVSNVLGREQGLEISKRVVNNSKSYEEALAIIREYVDLIDLDGEK